MEYRLLFEVGRWPSISWMVGLIPFMVIGIALVWNPTRYASGRGIERFRAGRYFILAFPILIGLVVISALASERSRLRGALKRHTYTVVEGKVVGFVPMEPSQHPPESWSVADRRYTIAPSYITMGFNTPGIVKEGMHVRIADVNGSIARLEVAVPAAHMMPR